MTISILTVQDLESPLRESPNHRKEIIKAIPNFTERQLLISLGNIYYSRENEIVNCLFDEISRRNLDRQKVIEEYTKINFFKNPFNEDCPCCNSKDHHILSDKKIIFCLVCGYDVYYDNPNSIWNRVRWKLGFYSFKRLSLKKLIDLLDL